ncbi:MAG: hypothetical protein QXU65_03310 [Sulfolobales archaeon]
MWFELLYEGCQALPLWSSRGVWCKVGSAGSPPSHCDKGHLDAVVEAKRER